MPKTNIAPTPRPSLTNNIENRYRKATKIGSGGYDAKKAGETFVDYFDNSFSNGFTKGGLNTGMPKKPSSLSPSDSALKPYGAL